MSAQGDPFGGVLRDLALVEAAVRGARYCLVVGGASPGPQLALALEASERAQHGLLALLGELIGDRCSRRRAELRRRRFRVRPGRCASARPPSRGR